MPAIGGLLVEEKRRHRRVQLNVPVTINRSVTARVVDLSESGVFVETSEPIEKGAALVIQFKEGAVRMVFGAIVRQSNRKKGGVYGFGAELGSLTPDHKEFVSAIIENVVKGNPRSEAPVILLIDGDVTSRFIYGKVLREGGCDVITRETFSDISVVFSHYNPAVVVLDYTEDAIGAVKSIRKSGAKIPIIILSRLPHVPMEKFEGLDVKHFPKYKMTPAKFFNDVLRKMLPR